MSVNTFDVPRCLVIPDVHQDIAWVDRILAREEIAADLIVFLGDYFDTRRPPDEIATLEATCHHLASLQSRLGPKAVFLLGNHDIQYLEAKPACDRHRTPRHLIHHCGASFRPSAARKIARHVPLDFWYAARLFLVVNGHLLTHAGLAPTLWPTRPTVTESIAALEAASRHALIHFRRAPQPLLLPGEARGGNALVGGFTWLDWDDEFTDALPLPQLVGHTGHPSGARHQGRSWCLDGMQTSYAILEGDRVLPARA